MSYGHTSTRLGGGAFNHGPSSSAEQEYDRLRDLARKEQGQHQHFAAEASKAYNQGDGGAAHNYSTQSKEHAARADAFNKQASEFIFRENNAVGKVAADTIDLHGQYVEEAEAIVEQRIRYAQSTGQSHLHVIVGKGNHSPDHIQKIKPRVEQVCRELGLQYHTEPNEGRMYVDLTGGGGGGGGGQQAAYHQQQQQQMPQYDYTQHHQPQHANYGQPHYETAYPMGTGPQYSYAQAAMGNNGYGGMQQPQQQQPQMQYGGQQASYPGQQQQQQQPMQYQEPPSQQQQGGLQCCGIKICVVM